MTRKQDNKVSTGNDKLLDFQNAVSSYKGLDDIVTNVNEYLIERYKEIEPIDRLSTEEKSNLIDVIIRSDSKSFGVYNYPTLEKKLAFILYSITKNHYLGNGNKRTAGLIFMSLFTIVNDHREDLKDELEHLKEITAEKVIYISESQASDSERVMQEIAEWIENL